MRPWPLVVGLLTLSPAARAQETPLAVHVQYPPAGATITASDSTFLFGRVEGAGGRIALTVNDQPVPVHPDGGWLAYVAIAPDSFTFRVRATDDGRSAAVDHTVWVPREVVAPGDPDLGYKPETVQPATPLELYAGDTFRVSVVAAPGQEVLAQLGDRLTPLAPERPAETNAGRVAFGLPEPAAQGTAGEASWLRYRGDVYATLSGESSDSLGLVFRRAGEAERVVPVTSVTFLDPSVVRVAIVDDDTASAGRTDHRVMGRAGPGGVFDLFIPNGTPVALGRLIGGRREIVLGPGKSAWVDPAEAFVVEAPRPRSEVPVVRTRLVEGWSEVVVPLAERLPFDVVQTLDPVRYRVTIYGATADTDIVRLTPSDELVRTVEWGQPENGVFTLDIELDADQAWGYRAAWEGSSLVLSFRHAPPTLADRRFRSHLRGVTVIVDPGHSPEPGAVGPTGLAEKDVNLEIALAVADILEKRGADVVLTRATRDSTLGLYDRTNLAVDAGGEVFVSIHNNALPDGVNPFANNGTSVLFYHPQSQPLAAAIQAELLPRTGLGDYGVWHDNLAVTRMNEMPSVLVEGAFMMIPEQEAMLRTPGFQRRIAEGVALGIERFLRERGR
ncbi:MAG: N-acetylmuramoyl-L-alanine amidase [Gemmatimonadota bacterium]